MKVYSIRDWNSLYETSETRKLKRLSWVPTPNKHDGNGYRRLMATADPGNLFTAFRLMVEVASKMPVRGILQDRDGPLDENDLAFKTGFAAKHFKKAFSILSNPELKIQWIDVTSPPESAGTPGDAPEILDTNRIELKGIEGNGMEEDVPQKPSGSNNLSELIIKAWNEQAKTYAFRKCIALSNKRKTMLKQRISDNKWLDHWQEAAKKIGSCPFLLGKNDRGWKATFDWFIRPDTVTKILEGAYDGEKGRKDVGRRFKSADTQRGKFDGVGTNFEV